MTEPGEEWARLLEAANAGAGPAYARFLTAVAPVVRGIVRARGHALDPGQQEDIVQEVLLAVHVKRHTWDPARPVRPWLYAIVRHKVVDAFRRRGGRVDLPIEGFADLLPAEAAPEPAAARDAERLIARLDPRAGGILRALALDGESVADVGRRFAMSEGAVRVALHRALRRLARLAQSGEVSGDVSGEGDRR